MSNVIQLGKVRLEDRSASLAITTIASDDDAIDVTDYSDTNDEDKWCDNRKTNRGCTKRTRYSSMHKVDWVNEVDDSMNQDPEILTVAECCREKLNYLDKEATKLSNFY